MEDDHLLTLKQVDKSGGELKPITSHPVRATGHTWQASEDAQVLALLSQVREMPVTAARVPDVSKPVAMEMSQEQAQALIKLLGAPCVGDIKPCCELLHKTCSITGLLLFIPAASKPSPQACLSPRRKLDVAVR